MKVGSQNNERAPSASIFTKKGNGGWRFRFGKHQGALVSATDPSYKNWMLDNFKNLSENDAEILRDEYKPKRKKASKKKLSSDTGRDTGELSKHMQARLEALESKMRAIEAIFSSPEDDLDVKTIIHPEEHNDEIPF